ncbi:threonine synthase [Halogranum rubrum]|uniref:Threonine synthase n=1 Tax=Halogranum salarium B-1 TaxID=1210908 RepID=J3A533_9EURY|nr:pyridoxal-phosphate dependent enzyme [Halogranum salarium]EJN60573.1 threonine synthase [Halogranum salarium B-1]
METTEAFDGLECTDCGTTFDATELGRCPDCDAPLDAVYDYDAVDIDRETLSPRPHEGLWQFDALLPFPASTAITTAEGATPLVEAPRFTDELDVERVVIKDDGRNPTGTTLDRGFSVAMTAVAQQEREDVTIASPGNGAQSLAAYAGRANVRHHSFVPSRSTFHNKAMTNVHGGDMRVVGGRFPDAVEAKADGVLDGWVDLQEFTTPYRHEGVKTLAYEIAAGLDWTVPDAVVVPTGTGEFLVGVEKGFRELQTVGLVDDVPRLVAAQPEGCAPIATAWERGLETPEPWSGPDTICGELEITDPAGGELALRALDATDGAAVTVDDDDALESAYSAARYEGIEMGANAGVAAAGAWELADEFDSDATVVLLNTEAGGKSSDLLRSHLMGKGI